MTGNWSNSPERKVSAARCRRWLLMMCMLVFQLANAQSYNPTGNILYVDQNVSIAGDGSSWDHAIRELADAMKWTAENRSSWSVLGPLKIYVAKGTYKPKYSPRDGAAFADEDRDNTFLLVPNVQLYGGFDPVNDIESLDDQRILPGQGTSGPEAGTILSGDVGEEGDDGDNTYHVVVAADDISTARLDGFFITDGNANGSEEIDIGGLQTRQYRGGGIYNAAPSTPSSSPVMANLAILSNRADDGAGVFNDYGAPRFINVIISGNEASYVGGGMYNWESSAELVNVRVTGNRARVYEGGGIVHEGYESLLKLTNVTISGNSADGDGYTDGDGIGGGLYVASGLSVEAVNTILWGNVTEVEGTEVYAEADAAITFRYSLVAGITAAYDGGNNLPGDANPRFVAAPEVPDAGAEEHFAPFTNGNYNLQARSPAVNAGDPAMDLSLFPGGPDNPLDLAGASRVYQPDGGGIIDLGAYEYQAKAEPVTDPPEQAELSLPADEEESIGLSPVLSWQEAEGADTYTVQFSTDGSFSSPAGTVVAGLTELEYTVEAPLLSQTMYYWRVRAENGVGDGEWSDVWKFTTRTEIAPGAGNILYVNQSATGSGTGSSWTDAIPELADALQWAREQWGDEGTDGGWGVGNPLQIQVAAGTYRAKYSVRDDEQADPESPENPGDRGFVLPPYLHLYGGYSPSGDGTQDIQGNETILSGDLDGDGTFSAGDAYHVLIVAGDVGTTMLDGFTVTGGNANGEGTAEVYGEPLERNYGAGLVFSALYADDFEPAVLNLTVSKNRAVQVGSNPGYGGGIYSYYGTYDGGNWPRLQDITVTDNEADYGGGIYVDSWSSPHFRRVVISRNTATEYGGGMYINRSSTPTILEGAEIKGNAAGVSGGGLVNSGWASVTNAIVNGNTAEYGGGIDNSNGAEFTLVNAVVSSNMASSLGGGVYAIYGNATARLVNVTISGNDADTGGGIYGGEQSTVSVANSIVWGNTANDEGHEIYVESYGGNNGTVELEATLYGNEVNDVEGAGTIVLGVGLMTADPRFRNVDDENSADYLRLALSSPAINVGNNTYYADAGRNLLHDTDVAGNPRVYDLVNDGIIDLGAYESWYAAVSPTDGVLYVDINVDMGKGPGDVLSDQSGSSWGNAIPELADALKWAKENESNWSATSPLKIYVAKGIYTPRYSVRTGAAFADENRDNAFMLVPNVQLYGGFDPGNNILELADQRLLPNPQPGSPDAGTVLSGDIDGNDHSDGTIAGDNAYHVVVAVEVDGHSVLDGFTVTGGLADGDGMINVGPADMQRSRGGGVAYVYATPTVSHVKITKNQADLGAGVAVIFAHADSEHNFKSVTICENTAHEGAGGMYVHNGGVRLTNALITRNNAVYGGGIVVYLLSDGTLALTNVTLAGNSGNIAPAGIRNDSGVGMVIRNRIIDNPIEGNIDVANSGNSIVRGRSEFLDVSPEFVDAANGDYRLQLNSPAINAGNHTYYVDAGGDLSNDMDVAGQPRQAGAVIDIGAFEYPIAIGPDENNILYVDKNVISRIGDGRSWSTAMPEFADALRWAREQWGSDGSTATWNAANPLKIFVAEGTYRPLYNAADGLYEADGGRDNAFVLLPHVEVYGGFAGTETSTDARSPDALAGHVHKTVLSGDFNDNDNPDDFDNHTENAHHAVIFPASATGAVLDGFTVSGGNADGGAGGIAIFGHSGYDRRSGGGIINYASSAVKNVSIRRNRAADPDGGLPKGAGVFNDGNATYTRVTIADNIAVDGAGGGMATYGSPTLTDVIIRNNSAKNGAGMIIRDTPILINVVINGNTLLDDDADRAGGVYNDGNYNPRFTNVTVSDNSGAAIFNGGGFLPTSGITLHNCIVWGGIAGMTGTSTVRYSLIEGNSSTADGNRDATGLTAADIFRDPAAGDYRLRLGSLAIDAGSNDLYEAADGEEENNSLSNDVDITGNPRVFGGASSGIIDMGGFEYQPAEQAITVAAIEKTYGDEPFEPGATADSGLPVSYSSGDNSIAEVFEDTEDGNTWKIRVLKAGEVTITVSQSGNSDYLPADDETFTLTIGKRAVEIGFAPDVLVGKEYDGTAAAAVSAAQLAFGTGNVLEGDDLSITLDDGSTATYGSADVGITKSVTLPLEQVSLGGADAANYVIGNTEDITGTVGAITPRELTVRTAAIGKEYDGTAGATVTFEPFNAADGLVGSDVVTVNFAGTAAYDSPDAGNSKAVTLSALPTLGGTEATNYTLTLPGLRGDITPRPVQVGFAPDAPVTKVYDGTVTATVDAEQLAFGAGDVLDGDELIIALADGTAAYDNPEVGTEKTVTLPLAQLSLGGADAGNYAIDNSADITGAAGSIAPAAIIGVTFGGRAFTYDGNAHSLAVEGLPADATVSYEENGQVNAGTYTVRAYVKQPNHATRELTAMLKIEKARPVITAVPAQTHVYDGTKKTIAVGVQPAELQEYLQYSPQRSFINVGNHHVRIYLNESANYLPAEAWVYVTVTAAPQQGIRLPDLTVTYDGKPHSLSVEGLPADATVSYINNSWVNAGSYTVKALVSRPNHADITLTGTLYINKAIAAITAKAEQEYVFDGTAKVVVAALNHNEAALDYLPQHAFTDVGTYNVAIVVAETANYHAAIAKVKLRILPAEQSGPFMVDQSVTYDGQPHGLSVGGLSTDADVAYTINGTTGNRATDAGVYEVVAVVSRPNYVDEVLSAMLTIDRAEAFLFGDENQVHPYDGTAKSLAVVLNHEEAVPTYIPQRSFTDAGTHTITVSAPQTLNYRAVSKTFTLRIDPATVPDITLADGSFPYDGTAKSLAILGTLPVGTTVSYSGSSRTDVGSQEVTATISGDNYNDLVLTAGLEITPAMRTLLFPVLPPKTYGDGDFDAGATASSGEEITYTSSNPVVAEVTTGGVIRITGAGMVTITATVPENGNYSNRPEISHTLAVHKVRQTLVLDVPAEVHRDRGSVPVMASSGSGLPVALAVDDPEVATLSGTTLHIHRLGTVRITATQAGDANHEAAEPVTVAIRVTDPSSDFPIRVHRAVSPNGDGINEYLIIEGIKDHPDNRVSIFNRNGTVVYEASGYNNGTVAFRGIGTGRHPVLAGTYFYVAEIRVEGEWKYKKGWFVLRY